MGYPKTAGGLLVLVTAIGAALWSTAADQILVGYITTGTDAGGRTPAGSALFSFSNPHGILVSQAGVGASEPARAFRIYVDEDGTRTAVALVNANASTATATLILRDSSGREVRRSPLTLGPAGHTARFVDELFTGLAAAFRGSLTVDSNLPLSAITLRESRNRRGEPLYSTLPVVDLGAPPDTQAAVFPHIAAGGGYTTQLILLNRTTAPLRGRIQLTASNGSPLELTSGGSTATTLPYQLEPDGVTRMDLQSPGGLAVGYATAVPDAGQPAPAGTVIFRFSNETTPVTEAGVAAAPRTTEARLYVDHSGTQTGVAVANPGPRPATLTFALTDTGGGTPSVATRVLPPLGHLAIFANELFPAMAAGFKGVLEVRSAEPIAPVTLKLTINALNDLILTTLPVADMTRSPGASTLVFAHAAIGSGYSTEVLLLSRNATAASSGTIRLFQSDGSPMTLQLNGETGSQFPYQIPAGGGRQFVPGESSAPVASLTLMDPAANVPTTEVVVTEGSTVALSLRAVDTNGQVRTSFPALFASANPAVATVDTNGNVRGIAPGFASLTVSSGTAIVTGTITVVQVSEGSGGFSTTGIAQDLARRLYLASSTDHTILLALDPAAVPALYAGVPRSGGLVNAPRLTASFRGPSFLAFDQSEGSLFVADTLNHVIRRVRPGANGAVETLAGTGTPGSVDGPLASASFNSPQGIALDDLGRLWVADTGNHTIRRIDLLAGRVETVAGRAGQAGNTDGGPTTALFRSPAGIAVEQENAAAQIDRVRRSVPPPPVTIVVADSGNGLIRRVRADGTVSTLQANVQGVTAVSGSIRTVRATGPARFDGPSGVGVDAAGTVFVSEPARNRLRAVLKTGDLVPATPPGVVLSPQGIAIAGSGQVVIAESATLRSIRYGSPEILSVTPDRAGSRGGETVTIRGSNFAPDTIVVVGGVPALSVRISDTQSLTFVTPAAPSGLGTLTLQNRGGIADYPFLMEGAPFTNLPSGFITTVGGGNTYAGDGRRALQADIIATGMAIDASGNVYFSDNERNRVRRIDARTGIVSTFAGTGQLGASGDGGPAILAKLFSPLGVALDRAGNVYVAESNNHRVRRISAATGIISTIAGGGGRGRDADGGPATEAFVFGPTGITVDAAGNVYFTVEQSVIRRVTPSGIISTVAGNWTAGYSGDGGPATLASLHLPKSVLVDPSGNLWIADTGNARIRRVDARTGIITTVAGTGVDGSTGNGGPATQARIDKPLFLALDPAGHLITAGSTVVRRIDLATGIITPVAGLGPAFGPPGNGGPAGLTSLQFITSLATDASGNIYISEDRFSWIRRVEARTGNIAPFAGLGSGRPSGNGLPATAIELTSPLEVKLDPDGNIVIVDEFYIRKVDIRTGVVTALTGDGTFSGTLPGRPAVGNPINSPNSVTWDSARNMYFNSGARVHRVDRASGLVSVFAGSDSETSRIRGMTFAGDGDLVVSDSYAQRVFRVNAVTRALSVIAGSGPSGVGLGGFGGDGGAATAARLNVPWGIAFDAAGNLFIADHSNSRVRRIDARTGVITTAAGGGSSSEDGVPATSTDLLAPRATVFDTLGNMFIVDVGRQNIRRVAAGTGLISTITGNGDIGFEGDNGPASRAVLAGPSNLVFDRDGNLFFADTRNHRIRVIRGPLP